MKCYLLLSLVSGMQSALSWTHSGRCGRMLACEAAQATGSLLTQAVRQMQKAFGLMIPSASTRRCLVNCKMEKNQKPFRMSFAFRALAIMLSTNGLEMQHKYRRVKATEYESSLHRDRSCSITTKQRALTDDSHQQVAGKCHQTTQLRQKGREKEGATRLSVLRLKTGMFILILATEQEMCLSARNTQCCIEKRIVKLLIFSSLGRRGR